MQCGSLPPLPAGARQWPSEANLNREIGGFNWVECLPNSMENYIPLRCTSDAMWTVEGQCTGQTNY